MALAVAEAVGSEVLVAIAGGVGVGKAARWPWRCGSGTASAAGAGPPASRSSRRDLPLPPRRRPAVPALGGASKKAAQHREHQQRNAAPPHPPLPRDTRRIASSLRSQDCRRASPPAQRSPGRALCRPDPVQTPPRLLHRASVSGVHGLPATRWPGPASPEPTRSRCFWARRQYGAGLGISSEGREGGQRCAPAPSSACRASRISCCHSASPTRSGCCPGARSARRTSAARLVLLDGAGEGSPYARRRSARRRSAAPPGPRVLRGGRRPGPLPLPPSLLPPRHLGRLTGKHGLGVAGVAGVAGRGRVGAEGGGRAGPGRWAARADRWPAGHSGVR